MGPGTAACCRQTVVRACTNWRVRRAARCSWCLLTAFDVLLGRHAGSEDVLVGTPLAGRPHSELEGLLGFFVNTLVLRTRLHGDPRFSELLARVRRVTLDAYEHADVPFEKLVEALAPQRSLSHSPIVQVLLTLHNQPRVPLALPGLEAEPVAVLGEAAKFDLSVHIAEEAADSRSPLPGAASCFRRRGSSRWPLIFWRCLKASLPRRTHRSANCCPA